MPGQKLLGDLAGEAVAPGGASPRRLETRRRLTTTAAVRATVLGDGGRVLQGLEARVEGKTAAPNVSGLVTITVLVPGEVEITVTGGGCFQRKAETLRPGINQVTIQLAAPGRGFRDPSLARRMRLRFTITVGGQTDVSEAEIVSGVGSDWKLPGAEFIAVGDVICVKSGAAWQKPEGPAGMMGAGGTTWNSGTAHVIASGEYAGFPARAALANRQGEKIAVDPYDFEAATEIKAPL